MIKSSIKFKRALFNIAQQPGSLIIKLFFSILYYVAGKESSE
jgi:hypothetical protein